MLCITFGVTWDKMDLLEILHKDKKSKLDYGVRLYEVEAASAMGIPFDHRWYTIDVRTREQMIASRLARISIDNILSEAARNRRPK